MNELKKTLEINRLLDIYGRLLTKQQFDIMTDYYNLDLSLSEISENKKISRTAVSDAINTSTKKLLNFEKNVGIVRVLNIYKKSNEELVNKIEEDLKNGI